jgi:hypothetical protein
VFMLLTQLHKLVTVARHIHDRAKHIQVYSLARALQVSVFLLLFEGLFGHNLYRYNWSWYCGLTAVALSSCYQYLVDEAQDWADFETREWASSTDCAAA